MRTRLVAVLTAVAVVMSVLAVQTTVPSSPAGAAGGGTVDLTGAVPASFTVASGVEQLTVTGATPRIPLTLVDAASLERVVTLFTDDLGQLVFQYVPDDFLVHDPQSQGVLPTVEGSTVPPGSYRVVSEGVPGEPFGGPLEATDPVAVLDVDDIPDTALYDSQVLPSVPSAILGGVKPGFSDEDGYGYLTVRDGTTLSVNVRLPDPDVYGPGPYPTVIQYSGYAPSRPGTPSGADAGGMLAGLMGFAYVGVNIRGSGCSGGVFDAFNAAQAADGYDVVETVARQPWVKHGAPGMMGISFSGITQLYVAATQPPSLAAITPLSVIEDPWYQQWPGGVYNAGFTQQWLANRDDEAAGGAQWVKDRISGGDATCEANKMLSSQNIPFEEFARSLERRPTDADARNLSLQVRDIDVPVYLTGAWQDEQTGSRFGLMLDDFDSVPAGGSKFTMFNGHHPDGYSPLVMSRWFEFLAFYVDRSVPVLHPLVRLGAGPVLENIFGVPGQSFEDDRFAGDYATALAAYEAEAPVRVLFEVGASPDFPAHPLAHRQRFEMTFPSWPVPDAAARTFFFGPDGALVDDHPSAVGIDRYAFEPDVLGERYYDGGGHDAIGVQNDWRVTPDGKGVAYLSEPLSEEMVVAGEGYVDLWLRADGTDVPIEVVLSEVYATPDDNGRDEVRVQNGLLRAGYRTVDPARSSGTQVDHLYGPGDYTPLTPGEFVNVKVPLFSVAHPFRAGSRVRIEVNTPGADAALWDFESDDFGTTTTDIAHGGLLASSLVLPVLGAGASPGASADGAPLIPEAFDEQSERPACDSLRGQPCRVHTPLDNGTLTDDYVPVVPERLLDTRAAQIGYTGPKPAAGDTVELDVTGRGTADVPDDAEAVVLNLTGTAASAAGHVTAYPCGEPRPQASNLNLTAGGTAPNNVVVGVGTDGEVCLHTSDGTHLIADIAGYYPAGSAYNPITPVRMLDTRAAQIGYSGPKPAAGEVVEVDLSGLTTELDGAGLEAVVLNVTGVGATADGHVTVYPCDAPRPWASNLNLTTGETRPNNVIVGVSSTGSVCLHTNAGTHLLVDVAGWYPIGSTYEPVVPERLLDTRAAQVGYSGPKPAAGDTVELDVTGVGAANVPASAEAVVLNVTGVDATADGHVTVHPCGTPRPQASNLNLTTGQTAPNLVVAPIGADGKVCLHTNAGTHLIADIAGYQLVG